MRPLFLPLVLISFTVLCLSILHIDNIDTLETTSEALQKKHERYRLVTKMKNKHQMVYDALLELK